MIAVRRGLRGWHVHRNGEGQTLGTTSKREKDTMSSQSNLRFDTLASRPRRAVTCAAFLGTLAISMLEAPPALAQSYPVARYNEVRMKMSHNSASQEESLLDQ